MGELTQKEKDIIWYIKEYYDLNRPPNIISKNEDKGILTDEERKYLCQLNIRRLLGVEEVYDIEPDIQLEKTRIKGCFTRSL